jgi:hypothetical protein
MALRDVEQGGYHVTVLVPRGVSISYKFLVDGVWRVDTTEQSEHPISKDGKVHTVLLNDSPVPAQRSDRVALTSQRNVPAPAISMRRRPINFNEDCTVSSDVPTAPNLNEDCAVPENKSGSACPAPCSRFDDGKSSGFAANARKSIRMHMTGGKWRAYLNASSGKESPSDSFSAFTSRPNDADNRRNVQPSRGVGGGRITDLSDVTPSFSAPHIRYSTTYKNTHTDTVAINKENVRTLNTALSTVQPNALGSRVDNKTASYGLSTSGVARSESFARHGPPLEKRRNSRHAGFFGSALELAEGRIDGPTHILKGCEDSNAKAAEKSQQISASATLPQTPGKMRRTANRGPMRSSNRNMQKVVVSGPTKVDQPFDTNDVHRTAQNWQDMARHLQEDLKDPVGARQLLQNAIEHREKHGLRSSIENAQAHIDLARSLGKAENLPDAEIHLRIALQLFETVDAAPDHVADLMHYIAVVADRQKKRTEAEELYRKALEMYKINGLTGDNVDIAWKNLALNLKKQNVHRNA